MAQICRHCSTPYRKGSGVDGFCCGGCREVHALICEEGLQDYYREQDRMAEPLKDRALSEVDQAACDQVQRQIEAAEGNNRAVFSVSGMSCMGCVWLIEKLAQRQAGVMRAQVSLSGQLLDVSWSPDRFELGALAEELLRFGYRLDPKPQPLERGRRLSPLAWRCLLSLVFTANALLLAVFSEVAGAFPLVDLLSLACLCFTCLLGGTPYFLSAFRAARIRRWHSDAWLALLIGIVLAYGGYLVAVGVFSVAWAALAGSVFVSSLIAARFLAAQATRWLR